MIPMTAPFTLAIDVGSPKSNRLGWAAGLERGGASSYAPVVDLLAARLNSDGRATIGFEAPIWAPRRERLLQVTDARQGVERNLGRAWTAGPGASALATCLGLMTWTFARIANPLRSRQHAGSIAGGSAAVSWYGKPS